MLEHNAFFGKKVPSQQAKISHLPSINHAFQEQLQKYASCTERKAPN
jgi:hypothetical protein